jgi:hypothetical protein
VIAAVAAALAFAAQAPRVEFHAYRVTGAAGTERVDFAGDPAAGCADRGVCGFSGTETFVPVRPDPGQLATFTRTAGRISGQAIFNGGNTTASVATAGSDTPCTDALFVRRAVVTFRRAGPKVEAILHGPAGEPPLAQDAGIFATHCAGPRVADLARAGALPSAVVGVSDLRRPTILLRLAADTTFSQAGFSGHVVADVRVRLKRDRRLEQLLRASGGLLSQAGLLGSSVAP